MKKSTYFNKIMSVDNFYKTIYKKNVNRMTALAIANKLSETNDIKDPIIFSGNGSRFIIKINVFESKPEFVFDIEKKNFGFDLGIVDKEFILYSMDIFKKYLKVSEYEMTTSGTKHFNNSSPISKYEFIKKYIDKLYEYEIKNNMINNEVG